MKNITLIYLFLFATQTILSCNGSNAGKQEKQDTAFTQKFLTHYENNNFNKTPRFAETVEYCKLLAQNSRKVNFISAGKSPQGRDIPLIILDKDGLKDPEKIRKKGRSVILAEAAIHAGEPDGKDAGLMLVRDIAIFDKYPGILDSVSLLFIPVINPDGHEDFGTHYRINQNGPEEVGSRFTAQRYNMNRDFIKADAPETRAFLKLYNNWMPELFIDIHVTNGADFQYVSTYGLDQCGYLAPAMHQWSKEIYEKELNIKMEQSGYPIFPYLEYTSYRDSSSVLLPSNFAPQYSNGYAYANNRIGLLVENHIYKPYKERVQAAYQILLHSLEIIGQNNHSLKESVAIADEYSSRTNFRKDSITLNYIHDSTKFQMVDFLAWQPKSEMSEMSGAQWTYSNRSAPVTYKMPYVNNYKEEDKIGVPVAYIIPQEQLQTIELLDIHSVQYSRLEKDTTIQLVTYRFHDPKWSTRPYEGRITLETNYTKQDEIVKCNKGDIYVSTAQPKIKVITHMLEPKSSTSLVYWGFYNSYVAPPTEFWISLNYMEVKGREMMEKDPELKAEFEKKKMEDKAFASNPKSILQFFMDKVRAGIEVNANQYPVYRLEK